MKKDKGLRWTFKVTHCKVSVQLSKNDKLKHYKNYLLHGHYSSVIVVKYEQPKNCYLLHSFFHHYHLICCKNVSCSFQNNFSCATHIESKANNTYYNDIYWCNIDLELYIIFIRRCIYADI